MAAPAARYRRPPEVLAFAEEWEAVLAAAVAGRMRTVGIPEEMIGIRGLPHEDPGAFVRTHAVGGSNNNIPGRGIVGERPGINVDIAVLDARFAPMSRVGSWASASLKDRIDAVIAHEHTEVQSTGPDGERSPHRLVIEVAPETSLKISERARQILREYRRIDPAD